MRTSEKRVEIVDAMAACRVYTPQPLADAIVRALDPQPSDTWLEPSVGGGVFLKCLAEAGVRPSQIVGLDVDARSERNDAYATVLRGREFLGWAQSTELRFMKIVANPPFVALHRAPAKMKVNALQVAGPDGLQVKGDANLWYAFLAASLNLLEVGGSLAFVLPAAWDYADYARPLRERIGSLFAHVDILRSAVPLFDVVDDGSVVLVARGYRLQQVRLHRTVFSGPRPLIAALEKLPPLDDTAPSVTLAVGNPLAHDCVGVRLREVMSIRIGAVTGDSKYFLLTETQRRTWELPKAACRSVVTRASQLQASTISRSRWTQLLRGGERVWMFRPSGRTLEHPAVVAYLREGQEKGLCRIDGHKISSRSPWHRVPLPKPAHAFMSGMASAGPWLCLNEAADIQATNTLYTIRFNPQVPKLQRFAWAIALQTSAAQRSLTSKGRRYSQGLLKFEPGDLKDVFLPMPPERRGAKAAYQLIVGKLLSGDVASARALADAWFSISTS